MRGSRHQVQLFSQHYRAKDGGCVFDVGLGGNEAPMTGKLPVSLFRRGSESLDCNRCCGSEIRRQKSLNRIRTVRTARRWQRRVTQRGFGYYQAGVRKLGTKCFTILPDLFERGQKILCDGGGLTQDLVNQCCREIGEWSLIVSQRPLSHSDLQSR